MSKPSQKRVELVNQGKVLLRTMKRRGGNREFYVVARYTGWGWENYHFTSHHKTEALARRELLQFVKSDPEKIIDDNLI